MKTQTRRILAVLLLIAVMFCSLATWGVVRVVAWARELPSRIVIDDDALANSFGTAVMAWYHSALAEGDSQTKQKVLGEFSKYIAEDASARTWIQAEFSEDLIRLTASPDAAVSSATTNFLADLATAPGDGQQKE